jgi:beta-mannosidase
MICGTSIAAPQEKLLHTNWRFRALNADAGAQFKEWHPATVPGVVQTDLLANKLIPDPFYQTNESALQWIGLTDWEYESHFDVDAATAAREHHELVFEGLDTFATVYLNGTQVLDADNMFRTWRVEVKKQVRTGDNVLRIVFRSPVMKLLPELEKLPYHLLSVNTAQSGAERGIPTDPFTRKAPYHYGWDWGPRFVTEGIHRPARLVSWDGVRIRNGHIDQQRITKEEAKLAVEIQVDSATRQTAEIRVNYDGGSASIKQELDPGTNTVSIPVRIANPKLWYPLGYGAQSRYSFAVTVKAGKADDSVSKMTGLRSIELRREPDKWGKTFEYVINGLPVFPKGFNFIPFVD